MPETPAPSDLGHFFVHRFWFPGRSKTGQFFGFGRVLRFLLPLLFGSLFAVVAAMLKDFNAYRISKEFYVALNIAEGSGKPSPADQRRFYGIALGSLRECHAILDIEQIKNERAYALADSLGAILWSLSRRQNPENQTATATETATPVSKPSQSDVTK